MHRDKTTTELFEEAAARGEAKKIIFTLFVAGMSPRSLKAVENARQLCEQHLQGRYELEVIDIYQQPEMAKEAQVVAVPTLIKHLPLPLQRFIGDLSAPERILVRLGIEQE